MAMSSRVEFLTRYIMVSAEADDAVQRRSHPGMSGDAAEAGGNRDGKALAGEKLCFVQLLTNLLHHRRRIGFVEPAEHDDEFVSAIAERHTG